MKQSNSLVSRNISSCLQALTLSRISTATFSREKRHKHCHFTFLGENISLRPVSWKKSQLFAPFRWEKNIQPMKIDFENRSRELFSQENVSVEIRLYIFNLNSKPSADLLLNLPHHFCPFSSVIVPPPCNLKQKNTYLLSLSTLRTFGSIRTVIREHAGFKQ